MTSIVTVLVPENEIRMVRPVEFLHVLDRITFDPNIWAVKRLSGPADSASVIVRKVAHGASLEETLERYPDLEREFI